MKKNAGILVAVVALVIVFSIIVAVTAPKAPAPQANAAPATDSAPAAATPQAKAIPPAPSKFKAEYERAEREYEKAEQAYQACVAKAEAPGNTTTMDDCKAPSGPSTLLRCMAAYDDAGLCKTIAHGLIKNGFTEKQVEMAWGRPEHVNTTCVEGTCSAQWVYESNDVYFTNGIVDGWDASQ